MRLIDRLFRAAGMRGPLAAAAGDRFGDQLAVVDIPAQAVWVE